MLAALLLTVTLQDDYGATWKKVEDAIETRFYARVQRHTEMEALLQKYAPIAKAAKSHAEFSKIMNQMIGDFRDSHFAFLSDADQGYYIMGDLAEGNQSAQMPEFGAWFRPAPGGYTVQMVLEGSEAAKAGLRKGDVVEQADGQPFEPILSLKKASGASLTVQRGSQTLTMKVAISSERCLDMFLDASKASQRVIDDNGRHIGYFHLWTQAAPQFRDALANAALSKLRDTDGFILDLRDGFGGRPEGYADPFFRPEVWLDWKPSGSNGYRELFGYARPLVVIINEGSRSAKEVLSFILKKSKRAVLIGSTTAGNVLGTAPQRINSWSILELPMVDVFADGVHLEGKGVSPDEPVSPEFDANGNDMFLAKALERLSRIPHYQPPAEVKA